MTLGIKSLKVLLKLVYGCASKHVYYDVTSYQLNPQHTRSRVAKNAKPSCAGLS